MESTIYKKLLVVSKEIDPISKDSTNPFFKSSYFDINKLIEVVRPVLSENDLVLLQPIKEGKQYSIIVDSESGESIESYLELPKIQDAQKLGSAITYFRRYTLQSLLGLQAEDDDGNVAKKQTDKQNAQQIEDRKPALTIEQFEATKKAPGDQIKTVLNKFRMSAEQRAELTILAKF